MTPGLGGLSARQRALLNQWLPGVSVARDHSWGLVQTTVLEVTFGGARFIVKAGGDGDHHIERELHAHLCWLRPRTSAGRAPVLEHGDAAAKLLVTRYLRAGSCWAATTPTSPPPTGRRASCWPGSTPRLWFTDDEYERRENDKALAWLSGPYRIAAPAAEMLRAQSASWPAPPAKLTPTHGHWQPRNWLIHDGIVSVNHP